MLAIDTHTHFFPSTLLESARKGLGPAGMRIERRDGTDVVHHADIAPYELPAFLYDPRQKLVQMDEDGIDVSLLAVVSNLFVYWLDPAETAEICRICNDDVARMVAEAPGRLYGLATVPLNDPRAAADELRRCKQELGLVGVSTGPCVGETQLDDPGLDPFFAAAEELRMPVMLHPYVNMMLDPPRGATGYHLENVIGNPLETATAGFRLIVGGVLDRHPGLEVQLSHGGGNFPYQLARLDHAWHVRESTSAIARRRPLDYLGQFLCDTVIFDRRALEFLIEFCGAERVVFGTDRIFDMADLLALHVAREERPPWAEAVLGGNARRSYSLPL
jgi:aminocarboxymuconate-semialdehyde decarboxylase